MKWTNCWYLYCKLSTHFKFWIRVFLLSLSICTRKAPEIFDKKTAPINLAKFTRKQMPLLEFLFCSKKELSRRSLSVNHRTKKWNVSLSISSANVTKSAVSYRFGNILIHQNAKKNSCDGVIFHNLAGLQLATILKNESIKSVFLRIL